MLVEQLLIGCVRPPARPLRETIDSVYIADLAASIKEHGLLNPLTVRKVSSGYEVVAGHCRFLALQYLGAAVVPAVVVELAEGDVAVLGAHENLQRRDMPIADEARLVAGLMGREGWGVAQTARSLRRSEGWVRDRLDLLQWPEEVVAGITAGRLAVGAAKALMGIEDAQARERLIAHALVSGVSVEVARQWRELENLGSGTAAQASMMSGVMTPAVLAGPSMPCFFCEAPSALAEMAYVWAHRECIVGMDEALRGDRAGGVPGGPPGGAAGVAQPIGPEA